MPFPSEQQEPFNEFNVLTAPPEGKVLAFTFPQFTFSKTPILNIFFKLQPEIFPVNSKEMEIVIENIKIEISCNELLNYNIQQTIIAEDYLKHFVGYHLRISFKKSIENRLEWKVKCLN